MGTLLMLNKACLSLLQISAGWKTLQACYVGSRLRIGTEKLWLPPSLAALLISLLPPKISRSKRSLNLNCLLVLPAAHFEYHSCFHGTSPQRHTKSHQIIQTIREPPLCCPWRFCVDTRLLFMYSLRFPFFWTSSSVVCPPPSKLECKEEALNADTHYRLAICLDKNYKDEAIVHYRKAMEINPHFVDAYLRLANLIDKGFYIYWITTNVA